LSTGTGVVLVVIGAVLYWGVGIDIPYVDDRTIGEVLIGLGLVGLLLGALSRMPARAHRSEMGAGTGVAMILAGAVLRWGLDVHTTKVNLDTLGLILIFVGVVAVAATLTMEWQRSRTQRRVEYRSPGTSRLSRWRG
jgi:hypothetical protein